MTDDKVKADIQFLSDALSWYDATDAATDMREAWFRLQDEMDKLEAEVAWRDRRIAVLDDGWKRCAESHAEVAAQRNEAEAKLTALVEITDRITPIPEVLEALAELPDEMNLYLDGAQAGAGWEIGPITVGDLRRLADIAHHSAPVREDQTEAQRAYIEAVALEFGGELPGDAWHLYRQQGLTPVQAAAEHRRIVGEE